MTAETTDPLRCSFCGKTQREVERLINGPNVRICNECVGICNEIIADDEAAAAVGADDERAGGSERPRAREAVHVGTLTCPRCRVVIELHTEATEGRS